MTFRNIFTLATFLIATNLMSQSVLADSFTIDKDGKTYMCDQIGGPTNPASAESCANKAYHGPFSKDQSMILCQGAKSDAPADCAINAYHGPFSIDQSLSLCKGARTVGPSDCAIKAYHGPFSIEQSLRLCTGPYATAANADCAINAYHGPYSMEESITLCKENPQLILRSLKIMQSSPELRQYFKSSKAAE